MSELRKVAIACQGGGSHAAFAAGVLDELLSPARRGRFRLVGLSGTSGGAMCAALVWRGLVASGADEGQRRLLQFWRDLAVHDPVDAIANFWNVWAASAPVKVDVSPYLYEPVAEARLRALLSTHLELESLTRDPASRARPVLLIGATDVLNGDRVIFPGECLSYDDLIASAAVPPLFRAVHANGHLYWDGLFTTNPPVREFTDLEEKPNELWVIQINPQHRSREPRGTREIIDRSNELAGNLSLGQELHFLQKINELRQAHPSLGERYGHIQIRVVALGDQALDFPSKYDRRGALIEHLIEMGRECAAAFFTEESLWPRACSIPTRSVRAERPHRQVPGAPA